MHSESECRSECKYCWTCLQFVFFHKIKCCVQIFPNRSVLYCKQWSYSKKHTSTLWINPVLIKLPLLNSVTNHNLLNKHLLFIVWCCRHLFIPNGGNLTQRPPWAVNKIQVGLQMFLLNTHQTDKKHWHTL